MSKTKQALRGHLISKRLQLSPQQQQHASHRIHRRLLHSLFFLKSKRLAFYFANRGEVYTEILLTQALENGKDCYLPILHPVTHNKMWFGRYQKGDPLIKNCYGILEPDPHVAELIPSQYLDVVITPLVAFDDSGNRLGMGGGFYDRTFSFLKNTVRTRPLLIGLAYEFQRITHLEIQSWDIPLNAVFTEAEVYFFGSMKV